ncbi:MAG: hypothetical protein KC416_12135 [Myxococcales bacterium]|nr:hypothetical protein [Myxococcales bacterium]
MRSFFDVIFVGSQLPALAAAAILSKRGFRVLVLDHDQRAPTYRIGDHTLPRAPFSLPPLDATGTRRVLTELALHQTVKQQERDTDIAFQVAIPGHRLDFPKEQAARAAQFEREFGDARFAIDEFHSRVEALERHLEPVFEEDVIWPPSTYLERRAFRKQMPSPTWQPDGEDPLRELPANHPFRMVVANVHRFATWRSPEQVTPTESMLLYGHWRRGPTTLLGGEAAFRKLLIDRIESHGGEVRAERAERLVLRRRRAVGVRLQGTSETIGSEFVVLGCELGIAARLLEDRRPIETLLESTGEPHVRHYRFTLNVVLDSCAVPLALSRDLFLTTPSDKAPAAHEILHVERHDHGEDQCLLCVEAIIPRRGVEDVAGYIASLRDRILDSLGRVIPFMGEHILLVDSPHDGRDALDMRSRSVIAPADPWSRGPTTMRPLHSYPKTTIMDLCAFPARTPVPGLYLCNGQTVPGLGAEGGLLAALTAAHLIARNDPKGAFLRSRAWIQRDSR